MDRDVKISSGIGLSSKGLCILLVFSCIATLLGFSTAYNEHKKLAVLSEKYDEAIVKINNCEEALTALVLQIEGSAVTEVTTTAPIEVTTEITEPESEFTEIVTTTYSHAESEGITPPQTTQSKPAEPQTTQQKTTEVKTTASAETSSGPYYVTQSGKKYHVGSCSYLSKSKITISWDRIKSEGYSPCSRCIK